jgi:hypothetical protein
MRVWTEDLFCLLGVSFIVCIRCAMLYGRAVCSCFVWKQVCVRTPDIDTWRFIKRWIFVYNISGSYSSYSSPVLTVLQFLQFLQFSSSYSSPVLTVLTVLQFLQFLQFSSYWFNSFLGLWSVHSTYVSLYRVEIGLQFEYVLSFGGNKTEKCPDPGPTTLIFYLLLSCRLLPCL